MVRDIIVPTKANLDSLMNEGSFALPRCISSCRGCQCHINTFSVDDMFNVQKDAVEGLFVPNEENYDSLIHGYNSDGVYCGCRCNCTACNSCRCDCSCIRITNNPEDYFSLLWDC